MVKEEVQSPCISVCAFDGIGLCQGCYRTAEEIEKWWDMSNEEKQAVLAKIAEREAAMFE
jgi:uncharacterized protein